MLTIGDGGNWAFVNGSWKDGEAGELTPPDGADVQYMAVAHRQAYSDFEATFRFKMRDPWDGARLLFRLQDGGRYYAFEIPYGGQQSRVRHFWAGVVVADGTCLQRYLDFKLVPGITPRLDHWYEARIECRGSRIRTWIEGRPVSDVIDETYTSGRIGLMAIVSPGTRTARFADVRVSGATVEPGALSRPEPPPPYWITPCTSVDKANYQSYPAIIRTAGGELIAEITFGNPNGGGVKYRKWVRSSDHGRTWSAPEEPPASLPGGISYYNAPFVRNDGTMVLIRCNSEGDPQEAMHTFESTDSGQTWTGPHRMNVQGTWPADFSLPAHAHCRPIRLSDGTLLFTVFCKISAATHFQQQVSTNFAFRSTDDGRTWSAPVRTDANNMPFEKWFYAATLSEAGIAETEPDVVVGLSRPAVDPYMWQVGSLDGGQTWEPAAYAPFPGYCISLTRTDNGALLAVTRYPYLAAHVSWDGGRTWDQGTILDYAGWANHSAIQVEPNVVLVIYMGDITRKGKADTRILRLRVEREGLRLAD